MKNSIYLFLTCFCLLATNAVLAQAETNEESPKTGLLQQADVLRCFRRMKLDMEDKARNLKEMKAVSGKDIEEFQDQYNGLRKSFNQFLAQFSEEVIAANGAPIDICELNKNQLESFLDLYRKYEDGFLYHYEQITNTHPSPLVEANFSASVANCKPKSAVVKPEVYQESYKPELVVASWASL